MMRKWIKNLMLLTGTLVVMIGLWAPSQATAQDPQHADTVPNVIPSIEPNYELDTEWPTIYAGIEQCRPLINNNPLFSVTFETVLGIDEEFDGVYHYNFPRGEESQISCLDSEDNVHEDCEGPLSDPTIIEHSEGVDVEAEISFEDLTGLTDESVCEDGDHDVSYYIQINVYVWNQNQTDLRRRRAEARFVLDLVRPEHPELTDVLATENSVTVEFERSVSDDVRRHLVFYSRESFEEGQLLDDISTVRSPRAVEGDESESGQVSAELEGGETVYVGMVARDRAGNFSPVSAPMEATVIETNDFWDFYTGAGGGEEGGYGCQTASTAPAAPAWWVAALFLMALIWRRATGSREVAKVTNFAGKDGRR